MRKLIYCAVVINLALVQTAFAEEAAKPTPIEEKARPTRWCARSGVAFPETASPIGTCDQRGANRC
jgi:hypothetical protein